MVDMDKYEPYAGAYEKFEKIIEQLNEGRQRQAREAVIDAQMPIRLLFPSLIFTADQTFWVKMRAHALPSFCTAYIAKAIS